MVIRVKPVLDSFGRRLLPVMKRAPSGSGFDIRWRRLIRRRVAAVRQSPAHVPVQEAVRGTQRSSLNEATQSSFASVVVKLTNDRDQEAKLFVLRLPNVEEIGVLPNVDIREVELYAWSRVRGPKGVGRECSHESWSTL